MAGKVKLQKLDNNFKPFKDETGKEVILELDHDAAQRLLAVKPAYYREVPGVPEKPKESRAAIEENPKP